MSFADAAVGANEALRALMVRREIERRQAQQDQVAQQQASRLDQQMALEQRQQSFTEQRQTTMDASAEQARAASEANAWGEQVPGGTFLGRDDAGVAMAKRGGREGLLTSAIQQRPPMGEEFTGPMATGETPVEAQSGRQQGYLKTSSAAQENTLADNAREDRKTAATAQAAQATLARQEAAGTETGRHNKAMEAIGRTTAAKVPTGGRLWVQRGGTAMRVAEGDVQPGDAPVLSASERMDARKFSKARPVLDAVSQLSERINTGQGVAAKISGAAERAKAQANLNDDVAEYQSLISGFTPMVARALGHTGVLTQQDVDSVKMLFPAPGDSKSLRDRKIARVMSIVGELETTTSGGAATATEYDFVNGQLVPRK